MSLMRKVGIFVWGAVNDFENLPQSHNFSSQYDLFTFYSENVGWVVVKVTYDASFICATISSDNGLLHISCCQAISWTNAN